LGRIEAKSAKEKLSPDELQRLDKLTNELSDRGEELRALVEPVGNLDVDEIIAMLSKARAS
jgi:hypothetical protein